MTDHKIGTREQWRAARLELLEAEKELTRRSDELARRRQELPWVRIEKEYRFETDEGPASLAELFRGRSQLLVYHFMFGPEYTAGCPTCSAIADGFSGFVVHLANHDVAFSAVSRAPLEKLQAYKRRMDWRFPWASSFGSDFNYDLGVSHTKEQWQSGAVEYNFRERDFRPPAGQAAPWLDEIGATVGTDWETYRREGPGMSAFALGDSVVYHTYSAYERGIDVLWACTSGSTGHHEGATRPACGTAATTSTTASDAFGRLRRARGLDDRAGRRSQPGSGSREAMTNHKIGTREAWLAACAQLLVREKEHTRLGDELAQQRGELPWVSVEKEYRFDADDGQKALVELFDGRSQLLVYHLMFGPSYQAGCPTCSSIADAVNGVLPHLHARDVRCVFVSQAPLEELQANKRRRAGASPGCRRPTVSSTSTSVSRVAKSGRAKWVAPILEQLPPIAGRNASETGTDVVGYLAELQGFSAFVLDEGAVYRMYSTDRGVEFLMGYYPILDRAPKGRDEGDAFRAWIRRHDEYGGKCTDAHE
jgi:predicted dithiol-disulfide oxidoreductase (DUF899 family)